MMPLSKTIISSNGPKDALKHTEILKLRLI